MDATLTINFCGNSFMTMDLTNALLEEYSDGCSLHADHDSALILRKSDYVNHITSENEDVFVLNNGTRYTIKWL